MDRNSKSLVWRNENVLTWQDARSQLQADINTIKHVPSAHVKFLSPLPPQRQAFGQAVCWSSAPLHPIRFSSHSVSFKHRLLESRQWTCPPGRQWASWGLNQWSLLVSALPDLCPVALQSVQPRSWDSVTNRRKCNSAYVMPHCPYFSHFPICISCLIDKHWPMNCIWRQLAWVNNNSQGPEPNTEV